MNGISLEGWHSICLRECAEDIDQVGSQQLIDHLCTERGWRLISLLARLPWEEGGRRGRRGLEEAIVQPILGALHSIRWTTQSHVNDAEKLNSLLDDDPQPKPPKRSHVRRPPRRNSVRGIAQRHRSSSSEEERHTLPDYQGRSRSSKDGPTTVIFEEDYYGLPLAWDEGHCSTSRLTDRMLGNLYDEFGGNVTQSAVATVVTLMAILRNTVVAIAHMDTKMGTRIDIGRRLSALMPEHEEGVEGQMTAVNLFVHRHCMFTLVTMLSHGDATDEHISSVSHLLCRVYTMVINSSSQSSTSIDTETQLQDICHRVIVAYIRGIITRLIDVRIDQVYVVQQSVALVAAMGDCSIGDAIVQLMVEGNHVMDIVQVLSQLCNHMARQVHHVTTSWHHNGLLEHDGNCVNAYMVDIIMECAKHSTEGEMLDLLLNGRTAMCCCIRPAKLIHLLYADIGASQKNEIMQVIRRKYLTPEIETCRHCERSAEEGEEEDVILHNAVKQSVVDAIEGGDEATFEYFTQLIPLLHEGTREEIVSEVILPLLCRTPDRHPLLGHMLDAVCTTMSSSSAVCTAMTSSSVYEVFSADLLPMMHTLLHSNKHSCHASLLACIQSAIVIESRATSSAARPVNSLWMVDQLVAMYKLVTVDMSGLCLPKADHYYNMVILVLQLCHRMMLNGNLSFVRAFEAQSCEILLNQLCRQAISSLPSVPLQSLHRHLTLMASIIDIQLESKCEDSVQRGFREESLTTFVRQTPRCWHSICHTIIDCALLSKRTTSDIIVNDATKEYEADDENSEVDRELKMDMMGKPEIRHPNMISLALRLLVEGVRVNKEVNESGVASIVERIVYICEGDEENVRKIVENDGVIEHLHTLCSSSSPSRAWPSLIHLLTMSIGGSTCQPHHVRLLLQMVVRRGAKEEAIVAITRTMQRIMHQESPRQAIVFPQPLLNFPPPPPKFVESGRHTAHKLRSNDAGSISRTSLDNCMMSSLDDIATVTTTHPSFVLPFAHDAALLIDMQCMDIRIAHGCTVSGWWRGRGNTTEAQARHIVTIGSRELSVSVYVKRGRILVMSIANLKMCIAGHSFHRWNVPCELHGMSLGQPMNIALGHTGEDGDTVNLMGNIQSFRGHLSHVQCAILWAYGVRCSTVIDAPLNSMVFNVGEVLHIFPSSPVDCNAELSHMQRRLLLCHTARNPSKFGVYVVPTEIPEKYANRVNLFEVEWRCATVVREETTLVDVVDTLGGISLLMFIYAHSVDIGSSSECQRSCLSLLVSLGRRHAMWHKVYYDNLDVPSLVTRVMASPNAKLDHNYVNTICDLCIDEFSTTPPSYKIRDAALLTRLLTDGRVWTSHDWWEEWQEMIEVLLLCVNEENDNAKQNVMQLIDADYVKTQLQMLLELFEGTYAPRSSTDIPPCDTLVDVIKCMTYTLMDEHVPLLGQLIAQVMQYIFVTHNASSTYVNYRVFNYNHWIDGGTMAGEGEEDLDQIYDSRLLDTLKEYIRVLNVDKMFDLLRQPDATLYLLRNVMKAEKDRFYSLEGRPHGEGEREHKDNLIHTMEGRTVRYIAHDHDDDNASLEGEFEGEFEDVLHDMSMGVDALSLHSHATPLPDLIPTMAVDEQYTEDEEEDDRSPGPPQSMATPCMTASRASLLGMLSTTMVTGSDVLLRRLTPNVINWKTLLVLLNHEADMPLRTAVVTAICALLERSTDVERFAFIKSHGFELLANQMREFDCNSTMASAVLSLVCAQSVRVEIGLDAVHVGEMECDRFQCSAVHLVLCVYQRSTHDASLCVSIANAILKMFEHNAVLEQALLDHHLISALMNTLHLLLPLADDLALDAWHSLSLRVLHVSVVCTELMHHRAAIDLITLLFIADLQCEEKTSHYVIRRELCIFLQAWMEGIRSLYSEGMQSASRVNSVEQLDMTSSRLSLRSSFSDASSLLRAPPTMRGSSNVISNSLSNLRHRIVSSIKPTPLSVRGLYRPTGHSLATSSELVERMKLSLQYCANLFLHLRVLPDEPDEEAHLQEYYLYFLFNGVGIQTGSTPRQRRNQSQGRSWQRLMLACKENMNTLLSQVIAHCVYSSNEKYSAALHRWRSTTPEHNQRRRQLCCVHMLATHPHCKPLLHTIVAQHPAHQPLLSLGIHDISLSEDTEEDNHKCDIVYRLLSKIVPSAILRRSTTTTLCQDIRREEISCIRSYLQLRHIWLGRLRSWTNHAHLQYSATSTLIGQTSMAITCSLVEAQNIPRKSFIQHAKQSIARGITAEQSLLRVVEEVCHPRGVCHDEASWPKSFALDTIEGPNRERRRMRAVHLGIDPKLVSEDYRERMEGERRPTPLCSILYANEGVGTNELASQLIDRLCIDETITFSSPAKVIRTTIVCTGELLLGTNSMHFVGDRSKTTQKGIPQAQLISVSWTYASIVEVYKRHYQLQDNAIEIFMSDGDTFLLCFESINRRDDFASRLLSKNVSNGMYSENLPLAITQWWREGVITNFEYLMHLNKRAGRTFSDLMQYPVFPFVLADYSSHSIDLRNANVFRQMGRPIAVQDRRLEDYYLRNYQCLQTEFRGEAGMAPMFGPYHYSSHYSNSGIVLHFLNRLQPFTSLAIEYQDGSFDMADRQFHSMEVAWRLSSGGSMTDFKELIPEMFFLPEMFINGEHLQLGEQQSGKTVDDVILPPFVPNNDARLFTLIHRQALESAEVTSSLHEWIDLVFGYKQTGEAAKKAVNLFHPATYHDTRYSVEAVDDELALNALKTMVKTYGQMPKQLFHTAHLPALHTVAKQRTSMASPLPSVLGVAWNTYCGSPTLPHPVIVLKTRHTKCHELVAMPDGACVGVPLGCSLLASYKTASSATQMITPWNGRQMENMAVISHNLVDGCLRLRSLWPEPSGPWKSMISLHGRRVTVCAHSPGTNQLFVAFDTGAIHVYRLHVQRSTITSCDLVRQLSLHSSSITCLDICEEYSVTASGDEEGNVLLSDVNKLTFHAAIERQKGRVTHLQMSKTMCDVLVVSDDGYGSRLSLYSVNGRPLGNTYVEISVSAITLTRRAEGTGINCVAVATSNGVIRLFELWTLSQIRQFSHDSYLEPIISMTFAEDDLKLYVCTRGGTILCWEAMQPLRHARPPRYIFANANV